MKMPWYISEKSFKITIVVKLLWLIFSHHYQYTYLHDIKYLQGRIGLKGDKGNKGESVRYVSTLDNFNN